MQHFKNMYAPVSTMNITLLCVGKVKERFTREWIEEFEKRISKHWKLTTIEIPEKNKKEENEKIQKQIKKEHYTIALDKNGISRSSESFSELLKEHQFQQITIIIGGPDGLEEETIKQCNTTISMGKMTWTHQIARLLITEQVYRAQEIQRGSGYHK